jgi:serine/threonine protein kinase
METLDSPHVIKYIEFINGTNYYYLVQEFANGGDLK